MVYATDIKNNSDSIAVCKLWESIKAFDKWLDRVGYESYDPYDLWGTKNGLLARRIYYKNKFAGLPFIIPFLAIETFIPSARALFVKKQRYATSDGQLILAYLNLYAISANMQYLTKAKFLAEDLLKISVPGYSGYCWGYPFDWQNSGALWKKNTPFITATPYCFEAYLALYDCTKEEIYYDIAKSISRFVADDLNETPTGPNSAAGSYSPIDNGKVVNASAYRAMVLIEASNRFYNERYYEKGLSNINFILQSQNEDGSWPYEMIEGKRSFIDHFHTCFVLKNLLKVNNHLNDIKIFESIKKGYAYYRSALFNSDGTPRPFAIQPRYQIITNDLYNYAEAITLGSLLKNKIDNAGEMARTLSERLITGYQLSKGYFVTKVYRGGIKTTFPFLRWSQAQLFYSLTNLLKIEN